MLYDKDWCILNYLEDKIEIDVKLIEEDIHRVLSTDLSLIKQRAVERAYEFVGMNPVICLSGGIDSQAMLNIIHDQNLPYTAITFDFGNGFNSQELEDAKRFAEFFNIDLKIIKLDVMRFLYTDLYEFAGKYNLTSPQFAVHCYFLEVIKSLGYTGAIFGGNGFLLNQDSVEFSLNDAQLLDLEKYSQISQFKVIPSFLSFDRDLCLTLSLSTSITPPDIEPINPFNKTDFDPVTRTIKQIIRVSEADRYTSKIKSYEKLGCKLIPQSNKKTGFEQIKEYHNSLNDSHWAFDREFRLPLRQRMPEILITTKIDPTVEKTIIDYSISKNSSDK